MDSDSERAAMDADSKRLAELGYSQELDRSWSGFSNFAISFSIISILAGCFTTFGQAWNNGGPIAISIGWPVISAFILIIGLCMSELLSAFPTAGGIYWWASRLGGPKAGFFTGWLNLVGLIAVTASVVYGCATFLSATISFFHPTWAGTLHQIFAIFFVIMVVVALINIFSAHLLALVNNVSAYWHVFGASAVVLILIFAPDHHQSASFVFTKTLNNSGFGGNYYWFYVLPLGFLLTQYTITGFDASAHLSEETKGASKAAARGLWQSIFYSAIGGWLLLLSFLFAATDVPAINKSAGSVISIFQTALSTRMAEAIMIIATVGQIFCSIACLTSCSRMLYAFSRDGAVPGHRMWKKVSKRRVPANGVILSAVVGVIITLPALYKSSAGIPTAFYAVVSVAVIGLYLAFLIPIFLRLRAGDSFEVGPWTLGRHYKWMCTVACIEIVLISIYFILPGVPAGWPGNKNFDFTAVNYAPILTGAVFIIVGLWWTLSAKHWFKGPKTTVADDPVLSELP